MIHQRALEFLLAAEGTALMRSFTEDSDPEFGRARVAGMRRLLAMDELDVEPVAVQWATAVDGYRVWSQTYDDPGNGLFAPEEEVVHRLLGGLPPGVAVDAACGTGRHSAWLAGQGHRVIGVDGSPDMLAVARGRSLPGASFLEGSLQRLPVPDLSANIVTCALALTHVADLRPVFAEFARVLRPGGSLVVSDASAELNALGSVPRVRLADGRPALIANHRHRASDYLSAALSAGFQVRSCDEPRWTVGDPWTTEDDDAPIEIGPWDTWPWSLVRYVHPAWHTAVADIPVLIIWHFQKEHFQKE
ncbi:class I SAM-dependent methyltransferase [Actinoplanes couchii]|uniref:Methyltransferase type 11 domain-containing protein n=1 Tax=Actinoplanes couchii TaxID=403638 RepID=A0ABQ3X045_9ACTN|nr:class I SAM-dependent methyltransferase [Actinoplanes couchii]MDR6316291.1 SAM-dependent methyltransferase [Actinoplanes couchii]GID51906.1 hypothetical protein Aco03nite_003100 [Actinoplanes couchii]